MSVCNCETCVQVHGTKLILAHDNFGPRSIKLGIEPVSHDRRRAGTAHASASRTKAGHPAIAEIGQ